MKYNVSKFDDVSIELIRKPLHFKTMLVASFNGERECVLDYYDTPTQAEKAMKRLVQCCEIAVQEGFRLDPEWFVHESGYRVSVAEGLAVH